MILQFCHLCNKSRSEYRGRPTRRRCRPTSPGNVLVMWSHGEIGIPATGGPGRSRRGPRGGIFPAAGAAGGTSAWTGRSPRWPARCSALRSMDRVHSAMCGAHDGWRMANADCGAPRPFPKSEWRDSDITRRRCVVGCSLLCSRLRRHTKTPPDTATAAGPAQRGEEHGH